MVGLAAVGTLSYNGYTFDGATHLEIDVEFERDDAGRTVVCNKHTLTVQAIIASDNGTDDSMEEIRQKLSKDGGTLVFENKGFGDGLQVNTNAGFRDVRWGPKPEVLAWNPIGSDKSCEVTWRVVTYLPPVCSSAGTFNAQGVMAFNYSVDFTLRKGYTTRTITGYIEIAQTRRGRTVPDCADLYRHLIHPPQPSNFARTHDYNISLDKSRLDFTIVDKQIESRNAYPPGVVDIRVNHRASWTRRTSAQQRHTITGEIEMAVNYPPVQALFIFLETAFRRISRVAGQNRAGIIIDGLDVEEEIFGTTSSFSLTYRVLRQLRDILAVGLWEPIGTNWDQWRTSVAATFHGRGYANMGLVAGNDAIIDLCGGGAIPWTDPGPHNPPSYPATTRRYGNVLPPPDSSWMDYKQDIIPARTKPVTRQPTLQTPESRADSESMNQTGGLTFPPAAGTSDTLSLGGRPRYGVRLQGCARRAGYPVPRPALLTVGNQTPEEVQTVSRQWCEGDYFGVPVFGAAWIVDYMLPNSPGRVLPRVQLENGGVG